MSKILIVGAGLSGATLAERLASAGFEVTIIEQRNHVAGNCYDYKDENGILINQYGAHIFHTNNARVQKYVEQFAEWKPWFHKVIGKIGQTHFPIPVNIDTVNILLQENILDEQDMKAWLQENSSNIDPVKNSEDIALNRVGPKLYELIFKEYTFKQWAKYPADLDKSVLERIPVRQDNNPYYFSDSFQALPVGGYTEFVKNMLSHPNIKVSLNTEYDHSMKNDYSHVFYTGPIDQYFSSSGLPKLEYRSIRFELERLDVDQYQPNSVVNYPSSEVLFTRIVEYKHFLDQKRPSKTTIVKEFTTGDGDPYYPVPTKENQELYEKYKKLTFEEGSKVSFVGRLANYKYYNMDQAILAALETFDEFVLHR